ncbi:activating signal cointegrator 1 complex subunit 3-like, partial [Stegodyphus dumicola]|uniref:activating signal cointegrator 1 complex subunit 3-like n=1 Tax=Stegodyphus dumicola TaxID=202533 RepID=UPI0015AE15BB
MYNQNQQPRLTSFLRAFSNVAAPWSGDPYDDCEALIQKRKEKNERNARLHNLATIKKFLIESSSLPPAEVNDLLTELMILAKEIAGSDSTSQIIEGTVVYLIELFRDCNMIGQKQSLELRRTFGVCPKESISKAFSISKKLIESLKDDIQETFIYSGFPKNDEGLLSEEFGSKIKFVDLQPLDESYFRVPLMDIEDEEKEDAFKKFSFKFEGTSNVIRKESAPVKTSVVPCKKYDQQWLEISLKDSASENLSSAELALSVSQLLKSDKSNEELQNELFDLLGYERFELIQDILKHRNEIIFSKVIEANNIKEPSVIEKRPSYMTQVVIQSETEKLLSKQIRKDEKRIQRDQNRGIEENPGILNPQRLKQLREEALITAHNTPLFHHASASSTVYETATYPNVYDMNAKTKMTASFISGRKLALPENAKRINNYVFEELHIPPSEPISPNIGGDLVQISSLDEIGQQVFKGTKSLNRIQSMVFNIAYHTQENMLVCAPTGAGKTNVALLTIVHEIKNNIENGVIQKNKFKIVYVAPMKALAAEMVRNFSSKLNPLGIQVKELTGDMQLTKNEIVQTQMLVTTPEKWDVVTRKSTGDVALSQLVKLLILDEVHLLDGDRGPVLEALVARTLRQIETSQSMIRIVGLSATLPNYIDVASFLRVNPMIGLFFFDDRFRPVPLSATFIGVKANNPLQQLRDMDEICYRKVAHLVEKHQVMVFVHARNATVKTATVLKDLAIKYNQTHLFIEQKNSSEFGAAQKCVLKSRNKELRQLFECGFAIHHAGMLRSDRNLVEKYFREGCIKVLVCTSTLAWGVNLPARAVIIKGTEIYDAKQGSFVDLSVLDVMQIFGRAGRPQFDKKGEGIIITTHDKLYHYSSLLTRQHQIESKFIDKIADNLNAEIALGTVANIDEGAEWLSYTYLYVRMLRNPHFYGLKPSKLKIALGTVANIDEGAEWLSYTYLYVRMLRNPHFYGLKPSKLK